MNTFQAVIVTDSAHSFVIFNYHPWNMNWNPDDLYDKNVIQGFRYGQLDKSQYVPIPDAMLFHPGMVTGNTGMQGRWVFHTDTLLDNYQNSRQYCYNWENRQTYPINYFNSYRRSADTCPCNILMAFFDRRYITSVAGGSGFCK